MRILVLVGGLGNFRGPVLGAALLIALPELLRFADLPDARAANLRLMIYGILLVLFMHFRPAGIAGVYRMERPMQTAPLLLKELHDFIDVLR